MKKNKKKKWLRPRHRIVRKLLSWTLGVYVRRKYNVKMERFAQQEKRPYLILYNHQTAFDQFMVGVSFSGAVYYLASEDLFSMGWVSRLISWLVAPIPIKKQATDVSAILTCMRVAREGGTIAIAPEGNRTFSGKTEYMSESIVPLARKLGLPIALYRIEGGYGVHPRWSDTVRKGKMRAYVSEVISPEEAKSMTDDALFARIKDGLYVNEAKVDELFTGEHNAEYLERALYVCPNCGLSSLHSEGDTITCPTCHRAVRYLPDKQLQGVGYSFPFSFVAEWYDYQCDFIRRLDPMQYVDEPMYRDTADFSEVIVYKRKQKICDDAQIALYGDRITVKIGEEEQTFPFDALSAVSVLGKNKLNIYQSTQTWQFKGDCRFNALKYVNVFYQYKNCKEGKHGTFLGL